MSPVSGLQTSELEAFLHDQAPKDSRFPKHLDHLALQILHNLQHQHRWTELEIHAEAPASRRSFPRPLISGLPPKRLYVHPDEQARILKSEAERGRRPTTLTSTPGGEDDDDGDRDDDADGDDDGPSALEAPQTEWVLPSHIREKWSLQRFAEVFDALDEKPTDDDRPWDAHKRIVLATLQDDSTIVYYVMHDGIVKPRQN